MTIRTNPELAALLNAATTQYDQVRVLGNALTATKRMKAKRHSNSATAQDQVWATGTLFRDCALLGEFQYSGAAITFYGATSDMTTATAADLATGKSVVRIEGNGHWVEGTVGLTDSGADFIVAVNPTATNSFAFTPTMRINANPALPAGLPDTTPPDVSLASSSTNVTTASTITLTATATDAVGVTQVEFYRNGALIGTDNASPFTQTQALAFTDNGTITYTAKAYDAAGNVGTSADLVVTVNIPEVVETGPAVAVGSNFTDIKFQNYSNTTETNVPVTFGQIFKVGALPATNAAVELVAADNSVVQCQLDVKNFHADGSVKHAILSAILPSVAANTTATFNIRRRASPVAGSAPVPANFAGLNATAVLTDTGLATSGPVTGSVFTADCAALLAAGTYETWLSGPICSEWLLRVPLKTSGGTEHPDMHARFNIRVYAGQTKAKIDYIIENNWAKEKAVPSGDTPWETVSVNLQMYRIELKSGSTVKYDRKDTAGWVRAKMGATNTYSATATGLANSSTTYNAVISVDGTPVNISVIGSQAQNFGQLRTILNTQLAGKATVATDISASGLIFTSNTVGYSSSVVLTDRGTLFPALGHTVIYRPVHGGEVVHFPATRWKKTFWTTTQPQIHIIHNKTYLIESKALPNYDPTVTGDAATRAAKYDELVANGDIGQNGITKAFMGDVGYAPGIGILPEWTAQYIVSQDRIAKETMLWMADLAGSWPVHWREYESDKPLLFSDWPYVSINGSLGDSLNSATGLKERLPQLVVYSALPVNRNQPDNSHCPDFCFVPYMVTGDHFYMEEELFYQRYTGIYQVSGSAYRDGRKCLFRSNQVRAMGWSIRTTAHTRYILPNSHPAIADIDYVFEQNRIWFDANVVSPSGQHYHPFGFYVSENTTTYDVSPGTNNAISSFMEDFFTQAIGRSMELGINKLTSLFNHRIRYQVQRLTSTPDFCWQAACRYNFKVRDDIGQPYYTSWATIYQNSVTPQQFAAECGSQEMAQALDDELPGMEPIPNSLTGYPKLMSGYPSNLQPALAYGVTFGAAGASDAWLVFDNRSLKPDYNVGPQFGIVPRT